MTLEPPTGMAPAAKLRIVYAHVRPEQMSAYETQYAPATTSADVFILGWYSIWCSFIIVDYVWTTG